MGWMKGLKFKAEGRFVWFLGIQSSNEKGCKY
jgi:hypothetical protein